MYWSKTTLALAGLLPGLTAALSTTTAEAQETDSSAVTEIVVWGTQKRFEGASKVDPRHVAVMTSDVADLLTYVPGTNVVKNGPVAGQAQYRGMFGPRLNVRIDGMAINSGGPNLMDPPLHYMPEPLLDELSVVRGISPVSLGPSIGGTIHAKAKTSHFTDSDTPTLQADVSTSMRTANDSYATGGMVGAATSKMRLHALGSVEHGGDLSFDGGKIHPEGFKRTVYGGGLGLRLDDQDISFDYRHHNTDHAGNPALPMDTRLFNTDLYNGKYKGSWNGIKLEAQVDYSDIKHEMDNFSQRTPPANPMMTRLVRASSTGLGFKVKASFNAIGGTVSVGADGLYAKNNMDIFNPLNPMFFVNNINQAKRDQTGIFAEWRGSVGDQLTGRIGVRYNRVAMDAGSVALAPMLPPPAQALAASFNAADRSKTYDMADVVVGLSYVVTPDLTATATFGHKTRAPSYLERFTWLPIEASAGLADGNNYVGDLMLSPEISNEIEVGFDWTGSRISLTPRAYYRRVNNYIQGTPVDATIGIIDSGLEMVSAGNGDATPLRFSNVDATLYGVDTAWRVEISKHMDLEGVLTYVRGKRRDINDNLYRITPLRASAGLTYKRAIWSATLEGVANAAQNKVSSTNGESKTPGYAVMNLHGQWQITDGAVLTGGIENIFDRLYRQHLAGFNRVVDSNVPIGVRLPGAGRNFFMRLSFTY